MHKIVDLRSDTVTRPTPEMREAMFQAEVGDDVFGDDPTINQLQTTAARLFGREAALFVPSGTMANQVSLAVHTSPGDEVYCEAGCHLRNYEGGAPAILSGVMLNAILGQRGAYHAQDLEPLLRSDDCHFPPSRLVWVENSANRAGGAIFPQRNIFELRDLADKHGLALHLDGARIWNVAAATGVTEKELAAPFDSISVCLSKGLGCPVGSLVIGSQNFIDQAHRFRKRFGGGLRQAGILAAAGLYALDQHRQRLVKDHQLARHLAETISTFSKCTIDLDSVQTNIVIFDVTLSGKTGAEIVAILLDQQILTYAFGNSVRMVTHLDITADGIERTIDVLRKLLV